MVRDGIYYALGMIMVAALLWWVGASFFAVVPLLLALFFLWFFRDPEREIPTGSGLIVSPADGKVTDVSPIHLNGKPCTRISIFLNVFDVHVNRSPIAGIIRDVTYKPGKFGSAMDGISAEQNEQNIVTVEGQGMLVVFKQIAGVLARRIVFTKKVGDVLRQGERVGLIKFGSRTDVIFPNPAELQIKVGDRVKGGSSILAKTAVPQAVAAPVREHSQAVL
jgi:phosphatidylserine decarboxylase